MIDSREFAKEAHGEQMFGERPYMFHVDGVADIIKQVAKDHEHFDILVDVAYLHDVPEDTNVTIEILRETFGYARSQAVHLLTDEDGRDRKERKLKTYQKFRDYPEEAIEVKQIAATDKYADRYFNMNHSYQEILSAEGEAKERGIRKLKVYVEEMVDFKATYYDYVLFDELKEMMEALIKNISELE